jgi:hypothetical protein
VHVAAWADADGAPSTRSGRQEARAATYA